MKQKLLHTPEGVRDIYNEECERFQLLQEQLKHSMERFGYHVIQTPSFEFFDIFGNEIGTIPSRELYKFFDREGNTLVLRPDITPSIARAAAKYFIDEELPIRLYYSGNTFINQSSYQGRLKETTQLGAEMIGDNSMAADAEMLALAVDCLKTSGLREFQLSVGHAQFFQGLVEAAGLDEEAVEELRELISNKNFFGVDELISNWDMKDDLRTLFQQLGSFYSNSEDLQETKRAAMAYPVIFQALQRLEELHQLLEVYGISKYVTFELAMISNYQYYTGITFAGYTYGTGEPIIKGGRYDALLSHFGKNSPSIGFAIVIDQLLAALSRQKISAALKENTTLIVYPLEKQEEAIRLAMEYRSKGSNVELLCLDASKNRADYEAYAKRNRRNQIVFMDGE